MELRHFRYFLAVAREQNFTAAANIMCVSQPALSKQIKALEEEVGKPLFVRGSKNVQLTEAGLFLKQRAEEILEPGIPAAKKQLEENGLPVNDENIFIVGCLQTKAGNKGIEFLKGERKIGVPKKDPNAAPAVDTKNMKAGQASTYRIALGNQSWDVQVSTLK